jgi:hypothetical protein
MKKKNIVSDCSEIGDCKTSLYSVLLENKCVLGVNQGSRPIPHGHYMRKWCLHLKNSELSSITPRILRQKKEWEYQEKN